MASTAMAAMRIGDGNDGGLQCPAEQVLPAPAPVVEHGQPRAADGRADRADPPRPAKAVGDHHRQA